MLFITGINQFGQILQFQSFFRNLASRERPQKRPIKTHTNLWAKHVENEAIWQRLASLFLQKDKQKYRLRNLQYQILVRLCCLQLSHLLHSFFLSLLLGSSTIAHFSLRSMDHTLLYTFCPLLSTSTLLSTFLPFSTLLYVSCPLSQFLILIIPTDLDCLTTDHYGLNVNPSIKASIVLQKSTRIITQLVTNIIFHI